jgi:hypothetical protein
VADFHSIVFNSDKTISDTTSQSLTNQATAHGKAAPDGAQTGVRIANVGAAFRMTVGPDGNAAPVSESPATASVQMADYGNGLDSVLGTLQRNGTAISPSEMRDTDTVEFQGLRTDVVSARRLGWLTTDRQGNAYNPTAETIRKIDGTAERERAEAAAQAAQAEAESTAKANTHPSAVIEAAHQSFVTQVSTSDQIGLMLALNSGKPVAPALMARVAEQLGQQPEQAQETLNNMARGVQAQFTVMARSQGLDENLAADWIRTHRADRVAAAVQQARPQVALGGARNSCPTRHWPSHAWGFFSRRLQHRAGKLLTLHVNVALERRERCPTRTLRRLARRTHLPAFTRLT